MRSSVVRNLIFDIGMCEGDDCDFYLKKGFRVLGVEADPENYKGVAIRFASEIAEGRLTVLNKAAFSKSGEKLQFFIDRENRGHSKLIGEQGLPQRLGEVVFVETASWDELVRVAGGVPYFCKIDVEDGEVPFLSSMSGQDIPEFTSVECHEFGPIENLYLLGYRKFRLIHQNSHNTFPAHNPPLEGNYLPGYRFDHSSGYFGEELFHQVWVDFPEIVGVYEALKRLRRHGALPYLWFDCHARFTNSGSNSGAQPNLAVS
jgi:FkbM family methyltransferase